MAHLPEALYRAEQVRALDRLLIGKYEISGIELMTRAAKAAFNSMRVHWPKAGLKGSRIAVFCGSGNNGGDGYLLAKFALEANLSVDLYQLGEFTRLSGDALKAREEYLACSGNIDEFRDEITNIVNYDLAVDALLGTGLDRKLEGLYLRVIEAINAMAKPVFSLDIPSGLNSDTGCVMAAAVKADVTISFIGLKQGMYTAQGPDYCGEIEFSSLHAPQELYADESAEVFIVKHSIISEMLEKRKASTHKGECGHVLIIGGSPGYVGALRLAGEAALRSGSGLVSLVVHPEALALMASAPAELMVHSGDNNAKLADLIDAVDVIAIGPGLGQSDWAKNIFAKVVQAGKKLIVDADALNILAKNSYKHNDWVLTPHPAEAGRLLNCETHIIQNDRFNAINILLKKYGATIVLKGVGSLIASADSAIALCTAGNPGMATAGMGDVLTGIIASLTAQGLSLPDAAKVGVYLHAHAADIAAENKPKGLIASDLMPVIRVLVNT